MEAEPMIADLSRPGAYPFAVDRIEVRQTHISAVFLAGTFAYKVKKPVVTGYLDFGTPAKRRACCEAEVALNRRTAPDVYLGVVPLTRNADGLRFEGDGEPVDWAVKMVRLPGEASLLSLLEAGRVGAATVRLMARRIAAFHAVARRGVGISADADFAAVARVVRENVERPALAEGTAVSHEVARRLRAHLDAELSRRRSLIESRSLRGVPCDGHGDLRPEHVYLFPDRPPPRDVAIIDCIEFSDRLRHVDPVADAAFMVAELKYLGRRDSAAEFTDAWFAANGDDEGRALLPLYTACRAAVRAKVEVLRATQQEVPAADREAALQRARGHALLALCELEPAEHRPALLLIGGLPGTGKTTLAHDLAERADFYVLRSDMIRKELAARAGASDIYTEEWNERTYSEVLRRAEELLFEGRRVVVDANFRREIRRRPYLEAAHRWGVPAAFLICKSEPEVARRRLESRRGDASDADWRVYLHAAAEWEPPGPQTRAVTVEIAAEGKRSDNLEAAAAALKPLGVVGEIPERPDTTAAFHPPAVPTAAV